MDIPTIWLHIRDIAYMHSPGRTYEFSSLKYYQPGFLTYNVGLTFMYIDLCGCLTHKSNKNTSWLYHAQVPFPAISNRTYYFFACLS